MLRARPGNFRVTDFQPRGRPDLTWYTRYKQYEDVVFADSPDLVGLLAPEGVRNAAGQVIIPKEQVKPKNQVRDSSNWYLEALTAGQLSLEGSTYVNERAEDLRKIIVEMCRIGVSVGHGVLYSADNALRLVSGTNVVPIQMAGNPLPEGVIMFWPYRYRTPNERTSPHSSIPNRIKVKTYMFATGEQTDATYLYRGGMIGEGPVPEEIVPDPRIQSLSVFGVDEGFYPEALKYAADIAKLDAVIRELTTTYALPVSIVGAKVGLINANGAVVDLQNRPIVMGSTRGLQDFSPDAEPLSFVQAMTMVQELMAEREELDDRYHETTRIPKEITRGSGDDMSGVSRALLARPAVDWLESFQRQVTASVDFNISAITGVSADLVVGWPKQPFDTLEERRLAASTEYNDGVITLNEYRQAVGKEPLPGGDVINGLNGNNQEASGNEGGESAGNGDSGRGGFFRRG